MKDTVIGVSQTGFFCYTLGINNFMGAPSVFFGSWCDTITYAAKPQTPRPVDTSLMLVSIQDNLWHRLFFAEKGRLQARLLLTAQNKPKYLFKKLVIKTYVAWLCSVIFLQILVIYCLYLFSTHHRCFSGCRCCPVGSSLSILSV